MMGEGVKRRSSTDQIMKAVLLFIVQQEATFMTGRRSQKETGYFSTPASLPICPPDSEKNK